MREKERKREREGEGGREREGQLKEEGRRYRVCRYEIESKRGVRADQLIDWQLGLHLKPYLIQVQPNLLVWQRTTRQLTAVALKGFLFIRSEASITM